MHSSQFRITGSKFNTVDALYESISWLINFICGLKKKNTFSHSG